MMKQDGVLWRCPSCHHQNYVSNEDFLAQANTSYDAQECTGCGEAVRVDFVVNVISVMKAES